MTLFPSHPFGKKIQEQDVLEEMARCRCWEDKYRYLIQLGKALPVLDETLKSETLSISGCESQVWLLAQEKEGRYYFAGDSDARIVKGLMALVFIVAHGKSKEAINAFDFKAYFEKMDLLEHLSQTRSNGIRGIIEKIKSL